MKNQPFKIEIEDVSKIYSKLKQKNNFSLGRIVLENPFEEASTQISNLDGKEWSSSTLLEMSKEKIIIPVKALKEKFKTRVIKNTVYVLDENEKPKYEIHASEDVPPSEFYILFGNSNEDLFSGCNTSTKPLSSLENFVKQFTEYKELVETVINGIYCEKKSSFQNNVMYWKYTGRTFDIDEEEEGKLYDIEEKIPEIQTEKPNVSFDEVGGQEKAKEEIKWLSHGLNNPEMYRNWGIIPSGKILLYGPPGTGKTLLAKALATETKADFYNIKISDIVSKWYGESEKILQQIFDSARGGDKTILFFDELDALTPKREDSHEVSGKIVSTLLTNLDGLMENPNLMVLGTTNRIKSIDSSLLRPGRFDRLIEVPLPNLEGRKNIFKIHVDKAEKLAGRTLFAPDDYSCLTKIEGFSGADIHEIVRRTLESRVRQELTTNQKCDLINSKDVQKEVNNYESIRRRKEHIGFTV